MTPEGGSFREATRRVRHLSATAEHIGVLARRMHFAVLDMLPDEDRATRSWEVEREDFIRRTEAQDDE